ncbi:MAG: hypothetical protein IT343_02695 [Candidatus Melainabacteria bacterium]|jgi:hypothetical protein|nr:hypothetical protein [Candidatus Melainabacteria bacterium]
MSSQTKEAKPILEAKPSPGRTRVYEEEEKVFSARTGNATRTKDILTILVTALPIIGALGTFFVWTATNFYVGDVEVQTSRPFNTITVKVFDPKGCEATFHTPKFQLMPGNYHLVINADSYSAQHADTNVAFHAKTKVQVELPSDLERAEAQAEPVKAKKKFWQFWRED